MWVGHQKEIRKLAFWVLALCRSPSSDLLRWRADSQNLSLWISLQWPIHIINPVDKTKSSCNTPQWGSIIETVMRCPEHFKWDQNPWFIHIHLSYTMSFSNLFIEECPPRNMYTLYGNITLRTRPAHQVIGFGYILCKCKCFETVMLQVRGLEGWWHTVCDPVEYVPGRQVTVWLESVFGQAWPRGQAVQSICPPVE